VSLGRDAAAVPRRLASLLIVVVLAGLAGCAREPWPRMTFRPLASDEAAVRTIRPEWTCAGGAFDAVLHGSPGDPPATWIIHGDGRREEVVWPPGYSARFHPGLLMFDEAGILVARDGTHVVGGCLQPDGMLVDLATSTHPSPRGGRPVATPKPPTAPAVRPLLSDGGPGAQCVVRRPRLGAGRGERSLWVNFRGPTGSPGPVSGRIVRCHRMRRSLAPQIGGPDPTATARSDQYSLAAKAAAKGQSSRACVAGSLPRGTAGACRIASHPPAQRNREGPLTDRCRPPAAVAKVPRRPRRMGDDRDLPVGYPTGTTAITGRGA
jgi:hypothetical protein